jgi:hypothetical protein
VSTTYAPFYDLVLSEHQKHLLGQVKTSSLVQTKAESFKANTQRKLIKHVIKKSCASTILNDFQLSNLAERMSGFARSQTWRLLYRMSEHGVSMITFTERLKREDITLICCEDQAGYKFGSLNFEEWVPRKKFYGTGESFVFKFANNSNEAKVFFGTGKN